MNDLTPQPMTVEEFITWTDRQPFGKFELINGRPMQQPAERATHLRVKSLVFLSLREAVRAAGLACEVFPDGATVKVGPKEAYEPDALVYQGALLPGDTIIVPEPLIVVEVLSPSNAATDTGRKLKGYFKVPSIRHYLVIDPEDREILHHARSPDGRIITAVVEQGRLNLDPPGLVLKHGDLFPPG